MFARYNLIFILFLLTNIVTVALIATVNEPLDGDQTRIGGFRENDFGWNAPQEELRELLFTKATGLADYTAYYDIVVYGDSFTFLKEKSTWLNYLIDITGWSAIAFHQKQCDIQAILDTAQFRKTPPKIFIFQGVERGIVDNLFFQTGAEPPVDSKLVLIKNTSLPVLQPLHTSKKTVFREKEWRDFSQRISETESYIGRMLQRKIVGISKVRVLTLKRRETPFFSSKAHHKILLFKEDFKKFTLADEEIVNATDKLKKITRLAEANRVTRFMPLIIPDKLTVYSSFLEEEIPGSRVSLIERMSNHYPLLRVDTSLAVGVKEDEVDIFLPNDTHTGSTGNMRIAKIVAEYLTHEISQ